MAAAAAAIDARIQSASASEREAAIEAFCAY
jgi:hypothetical protein